MSFTTNYNLIKPVSGNRAWESDINDNLKTIAGLIEDIKNSEGVAITAINKLATTVPAPRGYNMGFDFWQRGGFTDAELPAAFTSDGFFADMWEAVTISGTGLSGTGITRESGTTNFDTDYVARIHPNTNTVVECINYIPYKPAYQEFWKFVRGKIITFMIDIKKQSSSTDVRIFIRDTVSPLTPAETYSADAADNTNVQRLTVQRTIASNANTLIVGVEIDTTPSHNYVEIGNAVCVVGDFNTTTAPYIPRHPQEDFHGCCAVYQRVHFACEWFNLDPDGSGDYYEQSIIYPCPMLVRPTLDGSVSLPTATEQSPSNGITSVTFTPYTHTDGALEFTTNTSTRVIRQGTRLSTSNTENEFIRFNLEVT